MGVQLQVTDEVTQDVMAGLHLYLRHTREREPVSLVAEWLYWFEKNPFGKGVFSIAKQEDTVVGFCALIPIQMRLHGRTVKAAKAEFLIVSPDARDVIEPDCKTRLPFAIVRRLHEEAHRWHIEAVLAVATRAASVCHLLAGSKPMVYGSYSYVTYFQMPRVSRLSRHPVLRLGASLAALAYTRSLWGIRHLICQRCDVKPIQLEDIALPQQREAKPNALINPSKEMLAFRFPADQFLFYQADRGTSIPAYFVFSRPRRGATVTLKHWSTLDIDFSSFVGVLARVISDCRMQRARKLELSLPEGRLRAGHALRKLGFFSQRCLKTVYLWSDHRDDVELDPQSWELTNAHTGFV